MVRSKETLCGGGLLRRSAVVGFLVLLGGAASLPAPVMAIADLYTPPAIEAEDVPPAGPACPVSPEVSEAEDPVIVELREGRRAVSYTHLRAHETPEHL